MKRILLLITIVFLGISDLQAQNTCADKLKLAQRRFDEGLLDDIPKLIADCMISGFTKEEKANAFKLLIQTYLFNEQPEKADEIMLLFLREFSDYALAVNDPKEFINLYKTYRTEPIFKIQINFSGNYCMNKLIEDYGPYNFNQITPKYTPMLGFNGEINYLNILYKNLDYSIGASISFLRFIYDNNPDNSSSLSGTSSNLYIGLPVSIRYNFILKGISLIAKAGVEPAYLASSKINLTRNFKNGDNPFTGTLNLTGNHKLFDIKPFIAAGVNIKVSKMQFSVLAGMKFGTIVPLKNDSRLKDYTSYSKFKFQESRYLLNQPFLTVSYLRSIYKPKKIQ